MPGDCELSGGWLVQPVNTWSSLAFVAVGLVIATTTLRSGRHRWFLVLAAAAVIEGIGSVLFHADATRSGHFVHDAGLFAMGAFVAAWQVFRLGAARPGPRGRRTTIASVVVVAVGTPLWWITTDTTNIVVGVLIAVIVGSEIVARRRGLGGIWSALTGWTALALVAWGLGRSDSPLCDPDSPWQAHAAWHVLVAVVVLGWFDRALEADDHATAPRLFRRGIDRTIGAVAQLLVRTFHRSVETEGSLPSSDRPTLLVVNHGNGFVDPVVVAAARGRLPRFIAKAALWKVPVAGSLLDAAGALPVYRRSDGDDVSNNRSIFAACHDELARGGTVAIFPEGTTGDRASLDRVKSGAARIALGAVGGAPDLEIVPVGLAFESRYRTRSRVVVVVGEPIRVADRLTSPDSDESDHAAVDDLTSAITTALEAVSPQFASVEERDGFRASGRIVAASGETGRAESFAEVERTARSIAASSPDDRRAVMERFDRYARRLTAAGLVDRDLAARSVPLRRLALSVVALLLGGSLIVSATLIHLPALILVVGATTMVHATATKGTVRVLVGLIAGLATWLTAGVIIADGWAALGAAALVAVGGVVALAVWTPVVNALRVVVGRFRCRSRGSALEDIDEARLELVTVVGGVVGPGVAEQVSPADRAGAPV